MSKPTLLITGGAGFIGSNFVHRVLGQPADQSLVVFDKLTYAGNLGSLRGVVDDERFRFVQGDIADREAVRDLLAECKPTSIVNFAAESHVDRSIDGPAEFVRTNILGTFELLEAARGLWLEMPAAEKAAFRFLHISTDEVYGTLGPTGLFTEETPYAPNSPYAASKAAADHLARAYHETYGLPVVVTNCSNNYGPYQFPEKLIPLMILNALDGKPLPVYGDGRNVRDWIFVRDHCDGVLLGLERGQPGGKYNLGGGNERSNLEVVAAICDAIERRHPARSNPQLLRQGVANYSDLVRFVADRPGHDRRYAIDSSRSRRELGWSPVYDFAQGLDETVDWYLHNPQWCEEVQSGRYRRERLGLAVEASGEADQSLLGARDLAP